MAIEDCLAQAVKDGRLKKERADEFLKRLRAAEKTAQDGGLAGPSAYAFASSQAAEEMLNRARTRRAQVAAKIVAIDRAWEAAGAHSGGRFLGLVNVLGENLRGEARSGLSIATRERAVYGAVQGFIAEAIDAYRSRAAGLRKDIEGPANMVRELYGTGTGDALAQTSARGWNDGIDYLLHLLKAAGVPFRRLEDWRLPQKFDPLAVGAVGRDGFIRQMTDWWQSGALRLRDWEADVDASLTPGVDDARARDIFEGAYDAITTGGAASIEPGTIREAGLLDRYTRRRAFEWTSADAWLEFNRSFGVGDDGIFEAMAGHLRSMSRDVAVAQVLGPDPKGSLRVLLDMARKEGMSPGRVRFLENVYAQATGIAATPVSAKWATLMQGVRQWLTASQLGGAILSAPTDFGFTTATAAWNNLSMTRIMTEYIKGLNPATEAHRLRAARAGMILDVGLRSLGDGARENLTDVAARMPGRVADFVLRAQGLAIHTQSLRDAVGIEFQAHLADVASLAFDRLDPRDRRFFVTYGISAEEWDLLRAKAVVKGASTPYLDPAELARSGDGAEREAALKLIGAIAAEQRFAVPEGNTISRALLLGSSQPGTSSGELRRSLVQYKSFPISVMLFHGGRALDQIANPDGTWFRGSYAVGLAVLTTALGALSLQLKSIAAGKDAEPMDTPDFWARAFVQGGGAGIMGDFFSAAVARTGKDFGATLVGGPAVGLVSDLAALGIGNVGDYFEGRDSNLGREAVRFANRYTPDLWYTRLAADRLLWDTLQKMADPDYAGTWRRMEQRARRDRGVEFYWPPGEALPDRAPALAPVR